MDLQATQDILTRSLDKECPAETLQQARAMLKPSPQVTPETAISIYRNNHIQALTRSLAAAFPICRRILGDDCFNGIAREYVDQSPSKLSDLNRYGDSFPDFLGAWATGKTAFAEFGYLEDLARLEWYWHVAYYQEDDEPFDFTAFAKTSPSHMDKIRLRVSHTLNLLKSDYPVFEIWKINRGGEEADEVQAHELPQYLVVYRRNGYPVIEAVSADTHSLLQNCRNGKTLTELSEQVKTGEDRIVELLPELVRKTWVTGFEVI
jgi:hypothetical protein